MTSTATGAGALEDKREVEGKVDKSNLVTQGRRGAKLTEFGKVKIKALRDLMFGLYVGRVDLDVDKKIQDHELPDLKDLRLYVDSYMKVMTDKKEEQARIAKVKRDNLRVRVNARNEALGLTRKKGSKKHRMPVVDNKPAPSYNDLIKLHTIIRAAPRSDKELVKTNSINSQVDEQFNQRSETLASFVSKDRALSMSVARPATENVQDKAFEKEGGIEWTQLKTVSPLFWWLVPMLTANNLRPGNCCHDGASQALET